MASGNARNPRTVLTLGAAWWFLALSAAILAQKAPPSGPPTLASIPRPVVERGTTAELQASGANLGDPIAAGGSVPGSTKLIIDSAGAKDNSKIRFSVAADPKAPIGLYRLWLATPRGATTARPLAVDAFPVVVAGDNRSRDKAQAVKLPVTVTGKVDAETSEFYRFTVKAGERVSFEVIGRRLGSNLDPLIRIYDATGRELPRGYSEDAPGLQTDSRLTYIFPEAGEYILEVRDATHRGGADFHYIARMGDFPCAIAPIPLAARRGTKLSVQFAGPMVEGVKPVELEVPTDPGIEAVPLTPIGANGQPGWPIALMVSDHEELVAAPSIGDPSKAMRLTVPSGVTGRFLQKSQVDHYVVPVKKGQRYTIAAQTTELLSPAEVYFTVRDAKGAELGRSDPNQIAARLDVQPAADGDITIAVEHLHYAFGPSELYHLTVTQPKPSFEMTLSEDRVAIPQGQTGLVPLLTLTRTDFVGPIELSIVGHPGLSGSLTVAPDAQSGPPPAPGQEKGAPFAQIPVKVAADVPPGIYEVQLRGKAMIGGKEFVAVAGTKSLVSQALGNLYVPPPHWCRTMAIAVLPKPPIELSATFETPETSRGLSTRLKVKVQREANAKSPVVIQAQGLPANVTADAVTIPPEADTGELVIKVSDKAIQGRFAFTVSGRVEGEGQVLSALLVPPPLVIAQPFELKVEPNPLALVPGESARLTITATRRGGYDGQIALELRNLPANVSAGKVTIAKDANSAEVELKAAADAPLGAKGDVDVLGSVKLGNQQHASPPFTLRVVAPPPVLTVRAEAIGLKVGAKLRFKVEVERKNLTGPAVIAVEGLPANVTASPLTIPADKSSGEIELTSAADAQPATATLTLKASVGMTKSTAKVPLKLEK